MWRSSKGLVMLTPFFALKENLVCLPFSTGVTDFCHLENFIFGSPQTRSPTTSLLSKEVLT
uniref:Putative ovule protein n=1 Tax=Solanum chacoense TaxID=4108 RepID=A0A0V0H017_SOLCH